MKMIGIIMKIALSFLYSGLEWSSREVMIDFNSTLSPCLKDVEKPGIWCGEVCFPNKDWCRGDYSDSCNISGVQFTTNNRALCGNATVWINKTCDRFNEGGDKTSLGLRCAGEAQQCYFPWYLSGIFAYEVSERE